MKGCVRGYGNYKELTSSGVDPTELFDDIEDSIKSPDLVSPDIVIEESDDVVEEADRQDIKSPDHIHLLPIEKEARRRVRLRYSESDAGYNFDPVFGEGSIYTSPSLFSLVSIPDEFSKNKAREKLGLSNIILSMVFFRMC